MPLNMGKTWEMVIHGNSTEPIPNQIPSIERKTWLEILGTILQENPCNWNMDFHKLISKASSTLNAYNESMQILRYAIRTIRFTI